MVLDGDGIILGHLIIGIIGDGMILFGVVELFGEIIFGEVIDFGLIIHTGILIKITGLGVELFGEKVLIGIIGVGIIGIIETKDMEQGLPIIDLAEEQHQMEDIV